MIPKHSVVLDIKHSMEIKQNRPCGFFITIRTSDATIEADVRSAVHKKVNKVRNRQVKTLPLSLEKASHIICRYNSSTRDVASLAEIGS